MKVTIKKTVVTLFIFLLLLLAGFVFSCSAIYLYLSPTLPSVDSIRDVRLQEPLRVYSSDGKLIGEFGEKRRRPVKLDDVPQPFIDALLAAEDADFYSHSGVSVRGLARAITELIATGERGSGGSTLTMQLTRNVFLSLERKFVRKFNEILLSLKLERELSKDEILELYVNYMFLGKRAYGIQAASQVYYGKNLNELSLAQLAMIAGLFQGPSTQNPIINPTRAIERRNWILRRMQVLDLISDAAFSSALKESVTARYHGSQLDIRAPYVAEMAREKTIRSFGLKAYTEGYRVITTINSDLQISAQQSVRKGLMAYDQRHGYRGPEQRLPDLPDATFLPPVASANDSLGESENPGEEESNAFKIDDEHPWLVALKEIPAYAELEPAVIVAIEERRASALLQTGEIIELTWSNGLSSARPYLSENARGAAPQSASEVVAIGDVVRLVLNENNEWTLSQKPDAQAALVALKPNNGAILSIVGGFDFFENQFNRATQAYRQPGSNLKPFIYAAGLEDGMTAATLINDSPIVLEDAGYEGTWRPKNDGNKFLGPMRLRRALYLSKNLVSIRLTKELGIEKTRRALTRFGFDPEVLPRDLSLALGNAAVTPLELAEAWAALANGGYRVGAHMIERIYDNDGNIIYEAFPDTACVDCDKNEQSQNEALEPYSNARSEPFNLSEGSTNFETIKVVEPLIGFENELFELPVELKRALGWLEPGDYPKAPKVLDDQVAFIMDSILRDVIIKGTGRKARQLNRSDIAGKTGTTNGPVDVWFSGYNHDVVATTWVGFDRNTPLGNREFGSTAALPIWIDYMRDALKNSPEKTRSQPPGIVSIKIDLETGKRADIDDPDADFEFFRSEYVPEQENQGSSDLEESPLEAISEELF